MSSGSSPVFFQWWGVPMLSIIRIVAAAELVLIVLEALVGPLKRYLPLGGSHAAQVGILFAFGFFGIELIDGVRSGLGFIRSKRRGKGPASRSLR